MKYILKSLQIWHLIVFQLGIEQISQIKNKIELVFFFFFFFALLILFSMAAGCGRLGKTELCRRELGISALEVGAICTGIPNTLF